MKNRCHLVIIKKPGYTILKISGDMTSDAEILFRDTHKELFAEKQPVLIYDFTEMSYINSSGLALILDAVTTDEASVLQIRCFGLTPHFKKISHMVGMDSYVTIYDDEEEAIGG